MKTYPMPPEVQLLLHCVRAYLKRLSDVDGAPTVTTAATLPAHLHDTAIDWDYLIDLAMRHNVLPLLYKGVQLTCAEALPRATLLDLRSQFHLNARYNQQRSRALRDILALFAEHNILAVPYKGPALALFLYGDTALRQFGDLDILVHAWNIPKARELLVARGYRQDVQDRYIRECVLVHDEQQTWVELQWQIVAHQRLLTSFQFELSCLHERTIELPMEDGTIPSLPAEDLLLVLCAHASSHIWDQLQYICDITRLVQRYGTVLDWERVFDQAQKLGSERLVLLTLALARALLDTALPGLVVQRIAADPTLPALTAQTSARLFDPRGFRFRKRQAAETDSPIGLFASEGYLLQIKTRERWRDQVAYIVDYFLYHITVATTLDEKDRQMVALPPALTFLYYPLRVVRLCRVYGLQLLKHPLQSLVSRWR